jgi:hypothetical protein
MTKNAIFTLLIFLTPLATCIASSTPASSITASSIPASIISAYHSHFPNQAIISSSFAIGDINNDNLNDFAALVGDPSYSSNGVENLKLTAFVGRKGGSYSMLATSSDITGNERVSTHVKIYNKSIFLYRGGSNGCCSDWSERFQFSVRNNSLLLVGIEYSTFSNDDTDSQESSYGRSVNFLSHKIKYWRSTKKRHMTIFKTMPTSKLVTLGDFSDDRYSDYCGGMTCGYINKKFDFVQPN